MAASSLGQGPLHLVLVLLDQLVPDLLQPLVGLDLLAAPLLGQMVPLATYPPVSPLLGEVPQ